MPTVRLGNHTAVFAARAHQSRIREFYCGVLGCEARVQSNEVDRLQMGDTHFCFVYLPAALEPEGFLQSTYLELETDDVEGLKRQILEFGVRRIETTDPHLYFQAPGGQVFRVVGESEDLSAYERSTSTRPATGSPG